MECIKQNDKRLLPEIQNIGCFFLSCKIVAENKTGSFCTAQQINDTWKWAKDARRIDENDNVVDSASIINRFLRVLGNSCGRFIEVGLFKDGKSIFYPSFKNYPQLCKADALIQKITQSGKNKFHFRVVKNDGSLLQDPHEPQIRVLSVLYSILYAYEVKQ